MSNVFISYSHDTPEHKELALALSERLRRDGLVTSLDRYVMGTPEQGWPRWMLDQIDWADYVLLVCTDIYYRRFRGYEIPGKGKGVDWEGSVITQEIYDTRSTSKKFVPILFDPKNEPFIPEPVRGKTHYVLNSENSYQELYDFLLDQAGVEPGPIGIPKKKERKQAEPMSFGDTPAYNLEQPQISPTRLTHGADHLFGRERELELLDSAWANPATHVLTFVAFGGVGKTSLLVEWMNRRAVAGWPGMERVFDWSFYSQGTRDEGAASADTFIKTALTFFDDKEMAESNASAWDKGARLADLVAQKPSLLVLDGLEPLQYAPGPMAGKLKDPAIETLLRGLARRNPGLCLVTTRESVAELRAYRDTTSPEKELQHLSTQSGVNLLKFLGVKGADAEFEKLVEDMLGHALTLNLLGRFLAQACEGDIRKRDIISFQEADEEIQGGHAFRVMEAYAKWFTGEGKKGLRHVAVLRLLGLFDRPASAGCITALRKVPAISDLTETLVDQGKAQWNLTLSRLAECGLISLLDNQTLDAHPLIREYFAKQVREHKPKAWRAGHKRLYEYLMITTKDKANPSLDDLQPLYQAVSHGCQAGMLMEALIKTYQKRILKKNDFYSIRILGSFGADLGAVACFFEQPWNRVSPSLSDSTQCWLLNQASHILQGLGRLTEALEPINLAIASAIERQDWLHASDGSLKICEINLLLGKTTDAEAYAEQSIKFAERVDDPFNLMVSRVTLAYVMFQTGKNVVALEIFSEAEEMQAEQQPNLPMLYSLQGFLYCSFLMASAERNSWLQCLQPKEDYSIKGVSPLVNAETIINDLHLVQRRAVQTLEWSAQIGKSGRLDIAFGHLTLGCAALYRAILTDSQLKKTEYFQLADKELDTAIDDLRHAVHQDHISQGLLCRAWFRYLKGDTPGAQADLDEATEIAAREPMKLIMADIHLYRARLFHDREALKQARATIEECGYWRRKEELEDAELAAIKW